MLKVRLMGTKNDIKWLDTFYLMILKDKKIWINLWKRKSRYGQKKERMALRFL